MSLSIGCDFTLHDFHEPSFLVLKLLGKYHDGECLRYQIHQHLIIHIVFSLTQGSHSAVGRFTTVTVNGGKHCMPGSCRLLCGVCFRASHLSHTDNLRVETQGHIKEHILIDVLLFIFAESGQGMDDTVGYLSILLPNKSQLPASVLNGKDTLVIGNGSKEPPCQSCFAGAGGTCHTDTDSITQTFCQKI